jgi:hypothetical protein
VSTDNITDGLRAAEAECAEGRTAPRVTLDSMLAKIETEAYYNPPHAPTLTLCILTMQNGFHVTGESCPASAANFDPDLGRKLAKEQAIRKLWGFEGYALRTQLAAANA